MPGRDPGPSCTECQYWAAIQEQQVGAGAPPAGMSKTRPEALQKAAGSAPPPHHHGNPCAGGTPHRVLTQIVFSRSKIRATTKRRTHLNNFKRLSGCKVKCWGGGGQPLLTGRRGPRSLGSRLPSVSPESVREGSEIRSGGGGGACFSGNVRVSL